MKSPHSQAHSGGCNFGKGAAGGADDGAVCAGGLSDAEAAAARLNSAGRSPGNRGPSSLFSRRAHLLTTASAQTPYPSPRRKRQVSSIPLCLLFPQSQRLCGSPFAAVVCLAASCALRGGIAAVATVSRQCHSACKCCCHRLRRSQLLPFWKQLATCLRKPATGSFAAEMDGSPARPFSLLRKRN